jgi:hypothetical protein
MESLEQAGSPFAETGEDAYLPISRMVNKKTDQRELVGFL